MLRKIKADRIGELGMLFLILGLALLFAAAACIVPSLRASLHKIPGALKIGVGVLAAVGIVSNDFHIFRAVHIAKAQGLAAQGIPAPSDLGMYPHYMVREAFAVVKDLLVGNMVF